MFATVHRSARRVTAAALAVAAILGASLIASPSPASAQVRVVVCNLSTSTYLNSAGGVVAEGRISLCSEPANLEMTVCLQRWIGSWDTARCKRGTANIKRSLTVATEPRALCTRGRWYRTFVSATAKPAYGTGTPGVFSGPSRAVRVC
jgi:hypothetical protein